jgi:hypothetical protein
MTSAKQELLINSQTKHYRELGRIASTLVKPDFRYIYMLASGKVIKCKAIRNMEDTPDSRREKIEEILLRCLLAHNPGNIATYVRQRDRLLADLQITNEAHYEVELANNTKLRSFDLKIVEAVDVITYMANSLGFLPGCCRLCVI